MSLATVSAPEPGLQSDAEPSHSSYLQLERGPPEPVWLFATEAKTKHPVMLPDDKPVAATLRVTPTHMELASTPTSSDADIETVRDSQDLRGAISNSAWRAKLCLVDIVQKEKGRRPPHGPQPYSRGDVPGIELGILCAVHESDRTTVTTRRSIRITLRLRTTASPRSRSPVAQKKEAAEWVDRLVSVLKVDCDYLKAKAAIENDDAIYLRRILAGMCLDEIDNVAKPSILGELVDLRSAAWMDTGRTLLHLASQRGHVNCVRCLVDVNVVGTAFAAVFLNVTDHHDETALHLACKGIDYTHREIAEHLLRAGAIHSIQNENLQTAVDLAVVDIAGHSMKKILEPIVRTSTAHVLHDVADDGGDSLLDTIRDVLDTIHMQPRIVLEFLYRGGCSCVLALLSRDDNPCIQIQAAKVSGDLLSVLDEHASWPYHALIERICQPAGGVRLALVHRLVGHLASSTGGVQRAAAATLARDARSAHHPSIGSDLTENATSTQLYKMSLQLALLAVLHKELGTESEPVLRESDLWVEGRAIQARETRVKRIVRLYPSGLKIDKVVSKRKEHQQGRPLFSPLPELAPHAFWTFAGVGHGDDGASTATACWIENVELISTLGPVREHILHSNAGLRVTMRTGGLSDVFLFEAMDSSSCHAWYRAVKLAMDEARGLRSNGFSDISWKSRTPEAKESLIHRLLQASNPYSDDCYPAEWTEKTASLPKGQPPQTNTGRLLRIEDEFTTGSSGYRDDSFQCRTSVVREFRMAVTLTGSAESDVPTLESLERHVMEVECPRSRVKLIKLQSKRNGRLDEFLVQNDARGDAERFFSSALEQLKSHASAASTSSAEIIAPANVSTAMVADHSAQPSQPFQAEDEPLQRDSVIAQWTMSAQSESTAPERFQMQYGAKLFGNWKVPSEVEFTHRLESDGSIVYFGKVSGLDAGNSYKVRVRTIYTDRNGATVYGPWSKSSAVLHTESSSHDDGIASSRLPNASRASYAVAAQREAQARHDGTARSSTDVRDGLYLVFHIPVFVMNKLLITRAAAERELLLSEPAPQAFTIMEEMQNTDFEAIYDRAMCDQYQQQIHNGWKLPPRCYDKADRLECGQWIYVQANSGKRRNKLGGFGTILRSLGGALHRATLHEIDFVNFGIEKVLLYRHGNNGRKWLLPPGEPGAESIAEMEALGWRNPTPEHEAKAKTLTKGCRIFVLGYGEGTVTDVQQTRSLTHNHHEHTVLFDLDLDGGVRLDEVSVTNSDGDIKLVSTHVYQQVQKGNHIEYELKTDYLVTGQERQSIVFRRFKQFDDFRTAMIDQFPGLPKLTKGWTRHYEVHDRADQDPRVVELTAFLTALVAEPKIIMKDETKQFLGISHKFLEVSLKLRRRNNGGERWLLPPIGSPQKIPAMLDPELLEPEPELLEPEPEPESEPVEAEPEPEPEVVEAEPELELELEPDLQPAPAWEISQYMPDKESPWEARGGKSAKARSFLSASDVTVDDVCTWLYVHPDPRFKSICRLYAGLFGFYGVDGERLKSIFTAVDEDGRSDAVDSLLNQLHISLRWHRDALMQVLTGLSGFLGRYLLENGPPIHASATCLVFAAEDRKSRRRDGSYKCVVLKCMHDKESFDREITSNRKSSMNAVVPLIDWQIAPKRDLGLTRTASHRSVDEQQLTQEELLEQGAYSQSFTMLQEEFPHVLVMERGERSLHDACQHERLAGYDTKIIRSAFRDVLTCVESLHRSKVVHGDLKQRNILRYARQTGSGRNAQWILCDMDASALFGTTIGAKTSSGYAPPELAKRRFTCSCGGAINNGSDPCEKCAMDHAHPSFDVWSLGVILFELSSGRQLFAQDTSNDELVEHADKTRLCVWQTISDAELAPVFKSSHVDKEVARAAKDLIRWCLQGNPNNRPTVREILSHRFLDQTAGTMQNVPERYHCFLSHSQADASGTAAQLYLLYQRLGVHCWIDMRQDSITLDGMQQGVCDSSIFVLILTEHVLGSWFCQKEIMKAIEEQKQIQLILEEEPRFFPFDVNAWHKARQEGQMRKAKDAAGTEKEVPPQICKTIDDCLPHAVTFRRRDFEQDAMMRELCNRSGLVLPNPANVLRTMDGLVTPLQVVVISNAETAAPLLDELVPELKKSSRRIAVQPSPTKEEVTSADRVLLVLTKGVLEAPSRDLLEEAIRVDSEKLQDRIVAMYSEDAGWTFGGTEHARSSNGIRNCLNGHEAITYRPKDQDGPKRHEFPAMIAHVRTKLVGVGEDFEEGIPPL